PSTRSLIAQRRSSAGHAPSSTEICISNLLIGLRAGTSPVHLLAFVLHGGLGLVSANDAGDHRMAHHVRILEADDRDALDTLENLQGFDEARLDAARQVDLARVTGDDH